MQRVALGLLAAVVFSVGCASPVPPSERSPDSPDSRLDWWREARFGLFIHWGLYAIPAGEWKGETDHGEWIMTTAPIPLGEYESLRASFDPTLFDADAWAALAADAGMKYVVITTKHHDGFSLFDSKLTDYDVMSTPFQRDIMQELAAACAKRGLRIGWYHSIMDWHHPDYVARMEPGASTTESARFARYVEHLHGQVAELLTSYGPIGVMWFDGEWEPSWTNELGKELYAHCRRLQPDVIVNNRVSKGRGGMAGMTAVGDYPGDYGTPEQEIPARGLPGVDWETCMTMNDHWGYNRHDSKWKSSAELVEKLSEIASKGGNFLLNVGPTAEGLIPPPSIERLRAIGKWLATNGDAIYGTSASPFEELPFGRCTLRRTGDTSVLYLHVRDWPTSGELVVEGLANDVVSARLVADRAHELETSRAGASLSIRVPTSAPDPVLPVVELTIRGAPIVFDPPRIEAASTTFVEPIQVELAASTSDVAIHYTLDGSDPSATSPRYTAPLSIAETTELRARSFRDDRPLSAVRTGTFRRAVVRPAIEAGETTPGLMCERFFAISDTMPTFDPRLRIARERVSDVALEMDPRTQFTARRYRGFLNVAKDELYVFELESDDGSRLWIDGELVIDNDGLHVPVAKQGSIALAAGAHAIQVEYFNKHGGAKLALSMAPLGAELEPVRAADLSAR